MSNWYKCIALSIGSTFRTLEQLIEQLRRHTLLFGMLRAILPLLGLFAAFGLHAQTPYRIPVVVHVIHLDGPENISDAQIRNGIEILTRNYRKQNPDTVEIVTSFQPIAADMEVEFELARLDPDGNCTSGINRIRSAFTTTGTHNVKSLIHWPREKYLNIYIVRNAAGLAGHALMPFQADSIPAKDGIVVQGSYFGNTGTSNDLRSVVLSHELGHYLNLYHIWGGNNVPEFYYLPVGQQDNCDIGDEVDDTPETVGWSNCNLNGTSCDGELDNVQNFMDYAYCARMFTEGQKQRVHAALNSPLAQRNNLWTGANLSATGLGSAPVLCAADFNATRRTVCTTETLQFFDGSYHGATEWSWQLGGGQSSTQQNPGLSYSTSGIFDVTLTASNGSDQVSLTKTRFMRVLPATGQLLPYMEGFEAANDLTGTQLFEECEGSTCFSVAEGPAATGVRSMRLENGASGLRYAVSTPRLDMTQTPNPVLRFRYAFAQRDTANTDQLLVRISRDCGRTWLVRRTLAGAELPTVSGTVGGTFVPGDEDWTEVLVSNIPPGYQTNNVLIQFEFFSGGGHDLYIDDINIVDVDALNVPEQLSDAWSIHPNPATESFYVEGHFTQQNVELFTLEGRSLRSLGRVRAGQAIPVGDLPAGVYLVRISSGSLFAMRRLVVTR
ncbi:MAG: M43 family zinc metalloprotease [Flavobacteriales bacterium]